MWWRLRRREFEAQQGEKNRLAMKEIVEEGRVPGVLAYSGERPVGWCSVAPREEFGSLNRSRVLRPIDGESVWSIVCFYVARDRRGEGIVEGLIRAAIDYVRERGGSIVEAYPTVLESKQAPPTSSFMGFQEVFARIGFEECARPSESKSIMRYRID